ncbi:unnamed protein product [Medioppia subpectinata]|uniref:Serine/threonine-protein phosphatase n=1 Tax=Medioppia subpectinata TaxID=1979941 RepID=A0A7R9KSK7_9ACAR|nr:unnamed protein product [Medioppia subpectinata]CAG2109070.1 unnamed protein product [Medioppia subpectinata]
MDNSSGAILERMREFCGQYFIPGITRENRRAISSRLNRYVAAVTPALCQRVCDRLSAEPSLVSVGTPCYLFGDIHGNVKDLYDIECSFWMNSGLDQLQSARYVFLGDYVDRGDHSVEVAVYLLALRDAEPHRFTLLRGNHEVRLLNRSFTFWIECRKKFGLVVGERIWDQINRCFDRLPLVAIVGQSVFCCHGGPPRSATTLAELTHIPKPLISPEEVPSAQEILWNDPIESMSSYSAERTEETMRAKGQRWAVNRIRGTGFYYTAAAVQEFLDANGLRYLSDVRNRIRGTGFYYTAAAVQEFLDANGLRYLVRAHECVDTGYRVTSGGRVITVFSAFNYCGRNNATACVEVTTDGTIRPIVLKNRLGTVRRRSQTG